MKLWSTKWDSRGFRWYRWLVWFWWAKVRRRPDTVCRPDCPLCEVQVRIEAHYDACAICQGPGYPCEVMTGFDAEEQAAMRVVFPDLDAPTNGNRFPAIILPPWDWRK